MNDKKEKYGLGVAITMVAGIVIGSGIFFTVDDILSSSANNIIIGLLALILGALAMVFGSLVFGTIASRSKAQGGLVEYTNEAFGKRAGYTVGFFQATVYLPVIASLLAWISARYLLVFLGFSSDFASNSVVSWLLTLMLIAICYILNYFRPLLAGKFQVYSTIASLVPLIFVAIIGTILGIFRGTLQYNFDTAGNYFSETSGLNFFEVLFASVVLTSFAYDGWIIATNLKNEVKDSKKNLPKALLIGSLIVAVIYILFYIGMVSFVRSENMNDDSIMYVVSTILGHQIFGRIVIAFVVVSCLGTLNGLTLGSIRAPYLVALDDNGIMPEKLKQVNENGISKTSTLYAMFCTLFFAVVVFFNTNGWFGLLEPLGIKEVDLLVFAIVVLYIVFVALYINVMIKYKDLKKSKRFIQPIFALLGAVIIIYGAVTEPSILIGLIFSLVLILVSQKFYKKPKN